ncbi:MAG TPA: ABC transporter permease [Thermoplasmata archaeon]|nr:ABC transporter permease [Thermoplasmata archaeon]
MNLRRIAIYFQAFARGYIRNPMGLFFSLIFPVILILIFGAVFSGSGSSSVPIQVQNLDGNSYASHAFLDALNATGALSITMVGPSVGNLSSYLAQHSYTAGLVIPAGFQANYLNKSTVTVLVFTNPSAGAQAGVAVGAVQGVVNGFNLAAAKGTPIVQAANLQVGSAVYSYIDYLIPGLIGFSILISPMFSMVNISSTWKKDKLFRQLSLTPLTRAEWLTAALVWFILLSGISALLLVGAGHFLFGAHVTLTWSVLPFLVVGPVFFVSLGLLAGRVSSSPETAAVIGNIITFPMMFLSGTFFPVSSFPGYLQTVAHALPLFYVIDGLNAGILFSNNATALQDGLIILVLAVILFVAATRVFSWREE